MAVSFVWLQLLFANSTLPDDVKEPAAEGPFSVVVLDPGHGGQDSGTLKGGIQRRNLRSMSRVAPSGASAFKDSPFCSRATTIRTSRWPIASPWPMRNAIASSSAFISTMRQDRPLRASRRTMPSIRSQKSPAPPWLPLLERTALEPAKVESQNLASFIQEALVTHTQAVNRGTTPQQFFVLANARHPAVLVEGGFLTNTDEMTKLATEDYREQIAAAISDGVMRYREALRAARLHSRSVCPPVNSENPSSLSELTPSVTRVSPNATWPWGPRIPRIAIRQDGADKNLGLDFQQETVGIIREPDRGAAKFPVRLEFPVLSNLVQLQIEFDGIVRSGRASQSFAAQHRNRGQISGGSRIDDNALNIPFLSGWLRGRATPNTSRRASQSRSAGFLDPVLARRLGFPGGHAA